MGIAFAILVMQGRIESAVCLLGNVSGGSGTLCITDPCDNGKITVCNCLAVKHPSGQPVVSSVVIFISHESEFPHPITFESLTGVLFKSYAMSVEGAAWPSWANAINWRQFCSCFKRA